MTTTERDGGKTRRPLWPMTAAELDRLHTYYANRLRRLPAACDLSRAAFYHMDGNESLVGYGDNWDDWDLAIASAEQPDGVDGWRAALILEVALEALGPNARPGKRRRAGRVAATFLRYVDATDRLLTADKRPRYERPKFGWGRLPRRSARFRWTIVGHRLAGGDATGLGLGAFNRRRRRGRPPGRDEVMATRVWTTDCLCELAGFTLAEAAEVWNRRFPTAAYPDADVEAQFRTERNRVRRDLERILAPRARTTPEDALR